MKILSTIGTYLVIIGFIFNFIETAFFGFNVTAMSRNETICDSISLLLIQAGFGLVFLSVLLKNLTEK
jgi:hypothetical protein